jgi:lysophospholipase L1-like esterase
MRRLHLPALLALLLLTAGLGGAEPRLFLAGDSTMADRAPKPPDLEHGWGEGLRRLMLHPENFVNLAVNGRSTKSFRAEGRWDQLLARLQPGDFVLIQFGHNDQKQESPERYADAHGAYRDNLRRFVQEVRAHGAHPVLATSICRRKFSAEGLLQETLGDYPAVVRELAAAEQVPLLDLHVSTWNLLSRLGPERTKDLFMNVPPGVYPELPEGKQDDTHLKVAGADAVAALAVQEIFAKQLPLAALLRRPPAPTLNPPTSMSTPSDQAQIDTVIAAFYAAFDNRAGRHPTLAAVTACLHPRATVARATGGGFEIMGPADFAAPRVALLSSGELVDFHEWETAAETRITGDMATRQSTYTKAGLRSGQPYAGKGKKSFQLIREHGQWQILSVAWQDEP